MKWRIFVFVLMLAACKPGDYNYNLRAASGNTPEETAKGAIAQATADAAQEQLWYTKNMHDIEINNQLQQSELNAQAAKVKIQTGITTTLLLASAQQTEIVETGKAKAGAIKVLGYAAAIAIASVGISSAGAVGALTLYMLLYLAVYLWRITQRTQIQAVETLLDNVKVRYALIKADGHWYVQEPMGERSRVSDRTAVDLVRARMLEAAQRQLPGGTQDGDGLAWRFLAFFFKRAPRGVRATSNARPIRASIVEKDHAEQ